ncbi:MAG: lipopolysaccharide biosynthesis protein [Acidobacteria bacterium]|nr:lipopolysaccharide biosynthesis protein [Acidobacteriota bacterium]
MRDLKQKTIRGGIAKALSQAANFSLRLGSLMILARLLAPKDFGLVGMVTAVIGVFNVFRDFGLSAASVQRSSVTEEQTSTLFWINLLVGSILGAGALALAPLVVRFYHEPRLLGITAMLSAGFLFNSAGVQHSAFLERQMRFTTLSVIDLVSLSVSTVVGIVMALHGFGYWSLVVSTLVSPLIYTVGVWIASGWIPGWPRTRVGILSMLRFGGTVTMNGLVMYLASNLDKVLLGRFLGVDAVGIYGRAYQLVNIPTDNLNSSAGGVAFAALSRLQDEPARLKRYFLKGYSLVLSLTIPITCACALFAGDLIGVLLGPKWKDAVVVFRLLAPVTLVFAMLNPLGWFLSALGLVSRSLKIALALAPAMIVGYALGLHYGLTGVAVAYSIVMCLCVVPVMAWVVKGTAISLGDILSAASKPLLSGGAAAAIVFVLQLAYGPWMSQRPRLLTGVTILVVTYAGILLYVMKQKAFYIEIFRMLLNRTANSERVAASV